MYTQRRSLRVDRWRHQAGDDAECSPQTIPTARRSDKAGSGRGLVGASGHERRQRTSVQSILAMVSTDPTLFEGGISPWLGPGDGDGLGLPRQPLSGTGAEERTV